MSSPYNPYSPRGARPRLSFGGGPLTPGIKWLIIACVIVYLVQTMVPQMLEGIFGLSPAGFLGRFHLWQPVSYLFLHSAGQPMHLVINMLMLWMFGAELERRWGTQAFMQFYLLCGVGAGLLSVVVDLLVRLPASFGGGALLAVIPTIGASGAVYGLLAAQGILFPDRMLLLFFFFPVRMRAAVLILAGMMLLIAWSAPGSAVNHVAHLGGMGIAWLYLRRAWNVKRLWLDWRWRARRRKYKVVSDIKDDDRFRFH